MNIMKKITTLFLSLFTVNAFACPCPDLYKDPAPKEAIKVKGEEFRYKNFISSKNKIKSLDKYLNNNSEFKTIIGQDECKVTNYKKLRENSAILFLQVGCKKMKDNIHIVLPKVDVLDAKVNTCDTASKKFGSYVVCRGKL